MFAYERVSPMDWTPFLILGGFFAFMYMFIIRPQRQRQKQMRELMDSLAIGNEVVTIGGLHGKVTSLDEKTVSLQVADGTIVVFDRESVGRRVDVEEDGNE